MSTIKLFASLRKTAGQKELSITGATLNDVLNELVQQYPVLDDLIFEDGQLHSNIIITLNGQNITDLKVTVTDEDAIAIFPPIAGG